MPRVSLQKIAGLMKVKFFLLEVCCEYTFIKYYINIKYIYKYFCTVVNNSAAGTTCFPAFSFTNNNGTHL